MTPGSETSFDPKFRFPQRPLFRPSHLKMSFTVSRQFPRPNSWLYFPRVIHTTVLTVLGGLLTVALPCLSHAQNTGGVFGPVVNAGHKSFEYRLTQQAGQNGAEDGLAHRLHYKQAVNSSLMWRLVGQLQRSPESEFDPTSLRGELYWQITPDEQKWQSGFRFDATLRKGHRAESLGVHWTNQVALSDTVWTRFIVLTTAQWGDRAANGIGIQTRGALAKKIGSKTIGIELYSQYGTTANWRKTDQQVHQSGPFVSIPLPGKSSLYLNWLGSFTEASGGHQFRIRLGRTF